nr:hypothetical protein [Tanacetum cinerariifolium]
KQNQGDVNDAMGLKKKTAVVISDPLALIVKKTKCKLRPVGSPFFWQWEHPPLEVGTYIAMQTPSSGISILLAVGTPSTGSGNLYCQWELSPGSGNALCILFPTLTSEVLIDGRLIVLICSGLYINDDWKEVKQLLRMQLRLTLIINFLNANPIKYALTVNPTIYTSCIEQFWVTAKAKNINGEAQIHAKVDGKKVIISEATIRRDLKFEDEGGVDCLSNEVIFEQPPLMGVESSAEEQSLDEEDASKHGRNIADIDADVEIIFVDETIENQGMYDDQETFDTNVLNVEGVVVEDITAATTTAVSIDDITLAQALVEIKTSKPKARGIIMKEPSKTPTKNNNTNIFESSRQRKRITEEKEKAQLIEDENLDWDNVQAMMDANYEFAARLQEEEQGELTIEEKSRLFVELIDKRKNHFAKLRAEEQRRKPLTKAQKRNQMCAFDKTMSWINSFVPMESQVVKDKTVLTQESSLKRAGDKLDQGRSKKKKVEDDKEQQELKRCLEIIPYDGDDVTIDATPLSIKTLIINYKNYKEGKKSYF